MNSPIIVVGGISCENCLNQIGTIKAGLAVIRTTLNANRIFAAGPMTL